MEEYDSIFVLWITNLNFRTNENHLYEIFKKFGTLTCCKLLVNKDRLSKGIAIVKYEHNKDAQMALTEMTNANIDGRKITIELETEMVPKKNKLQRNESQGLLHSPNSTEDNNSNDHYNSLSTPRIKRNSLQNDNSPNKQNNELNSMHSRYKEKNIRGRDRDKDRSPYRKR